MHSLLIVFFIIILATTIRGYLGYRTIVDFAKINQHHTSSVDADGVILHCDDPIGARASLY